MTTDAWNPTQYDRFKDERTRPFFDLLALVRPKPGMRVVDLGCGTGALTRQMHERLGAVDSVGVDSSDAMLAKAASERAPGLRFEKGDLARFDAPASYDLVFSNAAVQWVDDHPAVFARFARALRPGGQVAVQMPANHDHPSHVIAAEIATSMGLRPRIHPVLAPEAYATILHRLGFAEQHVRLQVYAHVLGSRDDVIEWVRGTLLTDYEKQTTPERFREFLAAYRARLFEALPDERPFFYPFKRVLLWGAL